MLKNKKSLLILLFIIICFSFSTTCFATGVELNSDNSVTINGYTYVLDNMEGYTYYLYNKEKDTLCACIHARSSHWNCGGPFEFAIVDNGNNTFTINSRCSHYNEYSNYVEIEYDKENNTWVRVIDTGGKGKITYSGDVYSFVYSPMDIYNGFDLENSSFFYQTPQLRVELLNPMEVEEIPTLIQRVLIILVPVGLTIFGMLLLVYLISSKKWLHL